MQTAQSASFDCGKAASNVEKLICGNAELSKLDENLNNAYLRVIARSDVKQKAIDSQRQWLKNERNVCRSTECIKIAYEKRISELGFTSSFGITFLRPSGRNTSPNQSTDTDKVTEPQVGMPPVEIQKTQTLHKQSSERAKDCDTSNILDSAKLPKSKVVTQLVETAKIELDQHQIDCAVQTLENANRIVRSVANGTERAAMGFEIKDVALGIIQQERTLHTGAETRLILAATQSITADGKPIRKASEDERFNDTSFLGSVSDLYNRQNRNLEYRQIDLMMLRLNFSLPANKRWAERWRLTNFLADEHRNNYLGEVVELLKYAQDDVHQTYRTEFASGINRAAAGHMMAPLNLLSPESAKRDLEALDWLHSLLKEETLIWQMYLYMAEAYWQIGDKAKARDNLAKARSAVDEEGNLYWVANFLCNKATSCPFGIYDSREMNSLLDAVAKLAETDRLIRNKLDRIQAMRNRVSRTEER